MRIAEILPSRAIGAFAAIAMAGVAAAQQDAGDRQPDTTASLLGRLPDDVEAVIGMPAAFLQSGPRDEGKPVEALAAIVGGHALSMLLSADDRASDTENGAGPAHSFAARVDRLMIALWPADSGDRQRSGKHDDIDVLQNWKEWDGVVLLVVKRETSAEEWLRDFGFGRELPGHPHVVSREVKEGESPSVFAVALSEGIAAVAPSSAALEKISAAGEAGEARQRARIESWQAYRPEDRDPEFWAARKPEGGTGPARPFLRIGFSAASAADGTTLHLTYLFENKVPEEYVVGAALNSERDGYLPILDYGAAITVESVNGPKLVCKVRLDEGRGLDAAGATILAKLRTSARFRGGEKSP